VCKSKAFPVIAKLLASDDNVIQVEVYQALQNIIYGNGTRSGCDNLLLWLTEF